MESFFNKIEREANEEVKRIHREAQQIVDVLKALELNVPQELQHLLPHVKITSVKEATEEERKKPTGDHTKRVAKLQAKAKADYQQDRTRVREALSKGPKTIDQILEQVSFGRYRLQTIGTRMEKDGELDFSKTGFQGKSLWFLVERPVTLEQLRDEVVDRKGGDIPLQETQKKLGFQSQDHLIKMMDELVAQDIIRKEDGIYTNYAMTSMVDVRTLHEKKKYSRTGAVAGTGRFKVTSDHEVQGMLDKVKSQGGKVKPTNGGHIQIEHDGKTVTVGKSPGRSGILQDKNRVKQVLGLNV